MLSCCDSRAPSIGWRWRRPTEPRRRSDGAVERVAGRRVALVVARAEPLLALGRRAVRPRVRVDLAARRLLDPVVADRAGGIEGIRDLGRRERLEELGARGMVRPDAREAVGLELRPDRVALGAAGVAGLPQEAQQVLDVMAVFVGDDVALGERPAGRAEPVAQLLEEVGVEVDQLVGRAIERPGRGAGRAAAALGRAREQDRVDRPIRLTRTPGTRPSSTPGRC